MLVIFFYKIRTWEPGPVLGNLDLNRSLVWNPYSGTCIRTRKLGPVLVYILILFFPVLVYVLKLRSWPNIDIRYLIKSTFINVLSALKQASKSQLKLE